MGMRDTGKAMGSIVETIILGVIQGLTEWLPISSSGHLALVKELLNWHPPTIFYVLLHTSTLLVIIAFFRKDVLEIIRALVRGNFKSEEGKISVCIVVGSIPTAIIGYIFHDLFKSFFDNLPAIAVALLATGILLLLSEHRSGCRALSYFDSLLIGMAQGIAIIPGISRSGFTISVGLLRELDRRTAFRFSFLLSIPAVIGAIVAESGDLNFLLSEMDAFSVAVGIIVAMVVGYFSLKGLQKMVSEQKFHWFGVYCLLAGGLVLISQIL